MAPLTIDDASRVAILAGGGDLPLMIARSVLARGGAVHIVAIQDEADAAVAAFPHTWVNLGQATRMFSALRGDGPASTRNVMVIAGAVKRPDLSRLRPDFGFFKVMMQALALISAGGDDALLTKCIRLFERQGLVVVGVQDVAPELLIGAGPLGRHEPDAVAAGDLVRAREVLEALGDLDVGQGAVVARGRVLAIEGIEGTDRMLQRVAARQEDRLAVLLKAPKPRQERRVDLPTIGQRTITNARAAGIRGIAVVAGEAIGLQRDAMIATADAEGLFLTGIAPRPLPPPRSAFDLAIEVMTMRGARKADQADIARGVDAVWRLAPFAVGQVAAVTRGHILAVSGSEPAEDLPPRVRNFSQWGLGRFQGRRGVVVVRALAGDPDFDSAVLTREVAAAGFAGLAWVSTAGAMSDFDDKAAQRDAAVDLCQAAGLFLASVRIADSPHLHPEQLAR